MTTPEPPEFLTQDLSPVSAIPVHIPEPSNIPVLRRQTDPVFNMTSTHLESVAAPADPLVSNDDSPSADSSFSDAYRDAPVKTGERMDLTASSSSEDIDDYAMTFESDGEELADVLDTSRTDIVQETNSFTVPALERESPSSVASHDYTPTALLQSHPEAHSHHTSPFPTLPTTSEAAAAIPSDSPAEQTPIDSIKVQTHAYDDVGNGGIDIQQLLDNITANAQKNETTVVPQASSGALPKVASALPAHSSLPPRPNLPQKRPYDDGKYHAPAPGLPKIPSQYIPPPPGVAAPIIATGAPGTSIDSRGGLPPPPTASFQPPPPSASGPMTPASYNQMNRSSVQATQKPFVDARDEADESEAKWGPEIQKLYDEFLADERMYVTEGLWDRFPLGSRLFIGMK